MTIVSNEFNEFFVGVGPGLVGEIANTSSGNEVESKNVHVKESMFLKGTDEKELLTLLKEQEVYRQE